MGGKCASQMIASKQAAKESRIAGLHMALLALGCFIQLCLESQEKIHPKDHPHRLKCSGYLGSKLKRIV